MSWGDAWGSSPGNNAIRLAKAFYEARPLGGNSRSRVQITDAGCVEYMYNGVAIAQYIHMPLWIAYRLTSTSELSIDEDDKVLKFRSYYGDKGEARHLNALGVKATRQYDSRPFLIEGADAESKNWYTLDEWKAAPKWTAPVVIPKPRREPFIDLTMPLF